MCWAWCHKGRTVRVHAYTPGPTGGTGTVSAAARTTPVRRIYTSQTLSDEIPEELIRQIQTDNLSFKRQLGEGSFGEVFRWREAATGKAYAVKRMLIDPICGTAKCRGDYECAALEDIRSPYCVEGFGYEKTSRFLYVIMECVQGENLFDVLKSERFTLIEKKDIAA